MKIDRLIGILSILLQQEKVTAPYLAEKFEVSRRTINRDIEALCKAGIPLMTAQGAGGGVSVMKEYRLDRTVLTSVEMRAILAGLRSLDSVSGSNKYQQLMEKLSAGTSGALTSNDHIFINLSSWYKSTLTPKIELIQDAIGCCRLIEFQYCAPGGESSRKVEPYLLVFQWSSWYVWGYCLKRQDYRMFKLNRMLALQDTGESFTPRETPTYDTLPQTAFPPSLYATVLCEPEIKWRLIEEYGVESFEVREDGKLLFQAGFTDKGGLISWCLSFGNQIEVLEPVKLRQELAELALNIYKKYQQT